MKAFINGIGFLSPYKNLTINNIKQDLLSEVTQDYLTCFEPDYKEYINPMAARRMSRSIKMGIFSAKQCLADAGIEMPDAIVAGTGLGCIEDTEKFLINVIQNNETLLNPTPFIQSTHNTVSSQIAMFLKCHGYNITYSHRNLSFESALMDSLMQLNEGVVNNVLTGGLDEITPYSFRIMQRLGLWRPVNDNLPNAIFNRSRGAIAGEGTAFLLLSNTKMEKSYAKIALPHLITKQTKSDEMLSEISIFLSQHGLAPSDIDLFVAGYCGDKKSDLIYDAIHSNLLPKCGLAFFKHLCGDYFTATAFATALCATILKNQLIPALVSLKPSPKNPIRNILIYNHFFNNLHSLILLQHV